MTQQKSEERLIGNDFRKMLSKERAHLMEIAKTVARREAYSGLMSGITIGVAIGHPKSLPSWFQIGLILYALFGFCVFRSRSIKFINETAKPYEEPQP